MRNNLIYEAPSVEIIFVEVVEDILLISTDTSVSNPWDGSTEEEL